MESVDKILWLRFLNMKATNYDKKAKQNAFYLLPNYGGA